MNDVFAEETALKRRRDLLAVLMQQSQSAPIVGNTGLGQALAKLGTAWIAGKRGQELDSAESTNRGKYGEQLAGELSKFMQTREGAPGQVLDDAGASALMNQEINPQLADPVRADPKRAVFEAMASRFPEMKAVGGAGLKDVLARPAMEKPIEVNGQLVDPVTKQVIGDFRTKDKWSEPYEIPGPSGKLLVRKNLETGKVESVAGAGTNVSVNTGENSFIKGLGESVLPGGKSYEPAKAASQSLTLANEMVAAVNQGAKTGSLGNLQQELRKFGELMGVQNAATAPTEMLGNVSKQKVLAKLGGLGAQISNSDRDFLSSAQGDLSTNPEAMKRLLALSMAADLKEINRHSKSARALEGKIDPELLQAANIGFTAEIADPAISAMIDNVLAGKPTVAGVAGASSANPNPTAPGASPTTPMSLDQYVESMKKKAGR
jgi:hypothetical protein